MRRCYTTNQSYQNYSAQMDMSILKMWAFYKKFSNSKHDKSGYCKICSNQLVVIINYPSLYIHCKKKMIQK